MNPGVLGPLGLTQEEEQVYITLLEPGVGDVAGVVTCLGADTGAVTSAVGSLLRRGLVVCEEGEQLRAAPPAEVLGLLALRRMEELRKAKRQIEWLAQRYETRDAETLAMQVEVVRGAETMAARYALALRGAQQEICTFVKAPAIVTTPADNEGQRDALGSGVRFRVVYDQATLESGAVEFPLLLKELATLGEEMRVACDVPFKMVVIDRRTVLLIHAEPPHPYFLVVHNPLLADICQWVFETVWDWGLPVSEALSAMTTGELSADDQRLLALLLAGHTDESVAKTLDISARTVQRRVQRLLRLAGAQSRIQLGWQAARRDWI